MTDHPMRGCKCDAHERQRAAWRAWYERKRTGAPSPRDVPRPAPARPAPPLGVEAAIARGWPTSRIMAVLGCDYSTVRATRTRLEAANAAP